MDALRHRRHRPHRIGREDLRRPGTRVFEDRAHELRLHATFALGPSVRSLLSAAAAHRTGAVEPLDWSGWMGTAKATSMAIEILLRERVAAAGLLTRAGGSMWSMLGGIRTSPLVEEMIDAGELIDVTIEGSPRRYLAAPSVLKTKRASYDDRVRILGPLDPLLWDRNLVRHVFDFEYVWEVYKPAPQRKWGWYVCPLLYRDTLIGRIEARVERGTLIVQKLWLEGDGAHDDKRDAIAVALERHAALCGAKKVRMPRRRG